MHSRRACTCGLYKCTFAGCILLARANKADAYSMLQAPFVVNAHPLFRELSISKFSVLQQQQDSMSPKERPLYCRFLYAYIIKQPTIYNQHWCLFIYLINWNGEGERVGETAHNMHRIGCETSYDRIIICWKILWPLWQKFLVRSLNFCTC